MGLGLLGGGLVPNGAGGTMGPHWGPLPQLGGNLRLLHRMLLPFQAELRVTPLGHFPSHPWSTLLWLSQHQNVCLSLTVEPVGGLSPVSVGVGVERQNH